MEAAGIVLVGGRSSRMGRPKAALEWHGSTLLNRAAGLLRRMCLAPVVVVGAPGQELPGLPADVHVVEDPVEGRGPLQGIASGLAACPGAEAAFVCPVDLPFLHPAYVRRVLALLDGHDVVLPSAHGHRQPLAAAYRSSIAGTAAALLDAGRGRPPDLFATVDVRRVGEAELLADHVLATLDPGLGSLVNVNTPDEYAAARNRPAPTVLLEGRPVRAARLGALPPARYILNAAHAVDDPDLPLVAGDALLTALETR